MGNRGQIMRASSATERPTALSFRRRFFLAGPGGRGRRLGIQHVLKTDGSVWAMGGKWKR